MEEMEEGGFGGFGHAQRAPAEKEGESSCLSPLSSWLLLLGSCFLALASHLSPLTSQSQPSGFQKCRGIGLLHASEVGEHLELVAGVATAQNLVAEVLSHLGLQ